MNDFKWLPIYAAVVATLAFVWNVISYFLKMRTLVKIGNLCLTEWSTDDTKLEFRATNHKQESIKIEYFGFMTSSRQEFPPFGPPPECKLIPGKDFRKFMIPIKYIKKQYAPDIRSTFKFVFVRDTTGQRYKKTIPKSIIRVIAT